ncbi:MAG: hypothetical protein HN855_08045 [Anaerolineae bacterium]|jgi:hypothetical protein|nr:hypothetical protein [Anaerolineae bacterium]MBT7325093.1 hypothetical protein [Anaerolineae bacterium]
MRKIIVLRRAFSQAVGVMFRRALGERIFIFPYPTKAHRLYQTFFCPPLRIVALATRDEQKAEIVFDQVVQPWRFVKLPETDVVVEMAPDMQMDNVLVREILAEVNINAHQQVGGVDPNTGVQDLIFALLASAIADIRRVKAACGISGFGEVDPEIVQERFAPWERGSILASAGFILDYSLPAQISVPEGALFLSEQMVELEYEFQDELLAAAAAGTPWRREFPADCLGCGKSATWRFVLPGDDLSPELAWRLARPENAVPLCRDCARRLRFAKKEQVRRDLVWGLWGPRFEALERWSQAIRGNGAYLLPKNWDKETYPLWPREFGGDTWETGSGAIWCADPRGYEKVRRTKAQKKILAVILG